MLNKESKMNVPNFESHEETESWKLGIKLQFLVSWSKEQGFTPSTTTREVCANFIKPATQVTQLSYCEHLLQSEDTAEFVGFPSAFISHAWDDHFPEVLEALTSYFADEEDVIIWFDIFSNNQHKTASLEFDWWCDCPIVWSHSDGVSSLERSASSAERVVYLGVVLYDIREKIGWEMQV
mmetsp:Transcript_3623/g.3987  ORF Transcript_3623/g.3987 Transcript_3623/m.3987 type:complete len:180 (+) Transcript_3623:41-580(+)